MSAMFGESRGYGGYSPPAWRKREAELVEAKLDERPVRRFTSDEMRDARRERDARLTAADRHDADWRAFYGDPLVSDEQRDNDEADGRDDDMRDVPEMSGMELYREHTGHGRLPIGETFWTDYEGFPILVRVKGDDGFEYATEYVGSGGRWIAAPFETLYVTSGRINREHTGHGEAS